MKSLSFTLVSVLLVAGQSLADSCKTCRGTDCLADNVFELQCTKFVPALPFESQLISYEVGDDAEYGCLDLEYYIGDSVEAIQQCVQSNDLGSFCSMLENMLKIESCNVEPTGVKRSERSADYLLQSLEDVGSGETDSPGDKSTPSPLPSAGAIHLVSITYLLMAIVALLL